jgi:hypothetical protein
LVELTNSLDALEENFANRSAGELDRIRDRLWQLIERHAEAMATPGDPQRAEEMNEPQGPFKNNLHIVVVLAAVGIGIVCHMIGGKHTIYRE